VGGGLGSPARYKSTSRKPEAEARGGLEKEKAEGLVRLTKDLASIPLPKD